jgi:putative membrane protein
MTRICGILTIVAGLALSGCANDNVAWRDNNNPASDSQQASVATGDNNYERSRQDAYTGSNPGNTVADNTTGSNTNNNNAGPQLGSGNDKTIVAATLSPQDNRYINDALAGGMFEINASDKALMKSSDASIKNLAQHMVDDHSKANTQLKALANRKGMRIVEGMTDEQNNMLAQLDKLQGSDFDKEYLRQQQAAHQQAIQEFQDIANNAKDNDLRDWATATLPTLREHLQMVQNVTTGVINNNSGIGSDK